MSDVEEVIFLVVTVAALFALLVWIESTEDSP